MRPQAHHKIAFIFSLLLILVPALSLAQSTVNTKSFFSLKEDNVSGAPATPTEVKMPWFESYEFRTETRDFDLDRQEYTFRLKPSTRRKLKAQQSLYRHLEAAPDFEANDSRCQVLADRYTDWTEFYFLSREIDLLAQLEQVRADQSTVLNRLAGTLDFDWSELIKVRQDRTDLQIEYLTVQDRSAYLYESYGLRNLNLDFTDFLPLNALRERIRKATFFPSDPEIAYELETIERELELEKAEQKQYFNFAQVKYQGPHDDPARERLAVGVSLKLPNSGNQLVKIRELELEAEALRREQSREATDDAADFAARRQLLLDRFSRYGTFAELYLRERQEFTVLAEKLSGKEGINPLPLLRMKARALRNELELLRLEADLYQGYLGLMERNGEICSAVSGEVLR